MEDYISSTKQDRHKELDERKQINDFYDQQDVQHVFALYDKSLHHLYKFYASQDLKEVGFTLEQSMQTMNMREFVRFGYQENIVPGLVTPEDIVQVYRQLIRERVEEVEGKVKDQYLQDNKHAQVLDYNYFKKGLIRLAVMAQDWLGGQKEDLLLQKLERDRQRDLEDT